MVMDKADLLKFQERSQKEIRNSNKPGIAKVICIGCGDDVTTQARCLNCNDVNELDPKMMSINDSIFQHLTGFPVM